MVVVSHLFFFFDKKFGEGVTRYESHPPSLELSISRQPLCRIFPSAFFVVRLTVIFREVFLSFII